LTTRLPPLNALKAFESAARHLSLKQAAHELSVTPAAISHQVKSLEDYLGVALFKRMNRGLQLTPSARAALPKLREGFDALADASAMLRPQADGAQLTVSVAPSFAARWLMPRLHRFFAAHPEVDVRIIARTRLMNRRGQGNAAERATIENWLDESDVAILYGHGDYPGYQVDKLFALTLTALCAPQLTTGENRLRTAQDLRHHALVHDDTGMLYDGVAFWDLWLAAAGVDGVDTGRGSHFSQPVLAIEAASDGLGVVATLPVLASAELAAGRLLMPFAVNVPLSSAYYLACATGSASRPAVAAFREWLLAEAAQQTTI
jgi:LysR family transcriptional regulator, glycine cleavage system transcriptional activator